MTTALFLLRCTEVGISVRDLDLLTIGLILDMWTEKGNDSFEYRRVAEQEDFDKFYAEFSKANLFIFPTRAEFSAIVNCEAAAYALPIFTYDEGGTSSYVIDNYNGRVFNPNVDYTGYAAAIIEAIDNGMMEIYSYNSRKRYDDVLNWNHWGDVVNGWMQKNI